MRKYFHIILSVVAIAAGLAACKSDWYDNSPNESLKLSLTKIKEGCKETKVSISVMSRKGRWSVTGVTDWCTVSPEGGEKGISKVLVHLTANTAEGAEDRTTILTFTPEGEESAAKTIEVTQLESEDVPPRNPNEDLDLNRTIHEKVINYWYYWNRETQNTNPDYNKNYYNFYTRFLGTISGDPLTYDGNTWSTDVRRYLYSYIERNPVGTAARNLPRLNYGMEFELVTKGSYNPAARILYVLPGSPAAKAGLKRGDWFNRVGDINGKLIAMDNWKPAGNQRYQYEDRIDSLLHPIEGFSPQLGMLRYYPAEDRLVDEGRTVTLTPERFNKTRFTGNPILYSNSTNSGDPDQRPNNRIIVEKSTAEGNKDTRTGYLVLLNMDYGWKDALSLEFDRFREQEQLTHFILDLRYCKSGSVEVAEMIGNRLVPTAANGRNFATYQFNPERSGLGKTTEFQAVSGVSLEVPTILIITSHITAGAPELLINALSGINDVVKLFVVGDITEGMNMGMVRPPTFSDKIDSPDWEYEIGIVAFRCLGSTALGRDYQFGITPNVKITEWEKWPAANWQWMETWGWRGLPGRMEDPLLARAMEIVKSADPIPGKILPSETRKRNGLPRDFCFPTYMTMEEIDTRIPE